MKYIKTSNLSIKLTSAPNEHLLATLQIGTTMFDENHVVILKDTYFQLFR